MADRNELAAKLPAKRDSYFKNWSLTRSGKTKKMTKRGILSNNSERAYEQLEAAKRIILTARVIGVRSVAPRYP